MPEKINLKALNLSPYAWWETIENARQKTNPFAKELFGYDFITWLNKNEIQVTTTKFKLETGGEYGELYDEQDILGYRKVQQKSLLENVISAPSLEELKQNILFDSNHPLNFVYVIKDINHLCFNYFNRWLIFNTYEYWVMWRLYFEFIIQNSDKSKGDTYKHFWLHVLIDVDFQEQFEDLKQYKQFATIKNKFEKESEYILDKWVEKRDKKNKSE